jgi:nicotinamide phosphoribosyltransferase
MNNLIFLTDSYKVSHHKQYPKGTEYVYSYFESRGGKFKEACFFGLQYLIKKHLCGQVVTQEMINEASELYEKHFGPNQNVFNKEGWQYILDTHGGRLPIQIKAVPEGTILPVKNCCMTVENTDPECFWLVNFVETLLVQVWYPMTVATNSREQKKIIMKYLEETGDPATVGFKLHDFGCRGVSSMETAGIGGCAHLTQFLGTDTVPALIVANEYYDCECAGFSIPASEHSTMTTYTKEGEVQAYENMLDTYPNGLVAVVSDSYDVYHACSEIWGTILRDKVMARDGTLVIRPDSGYPPDVDLKILQILGEKFGAQKNEKGYLVLDEHVKIIQGDGIDKEMLETILEHLKTNGWSADNIAFGSGGGLLQKMNRDTLKCAFKCSCVTINGKEVDVFKDPIDDPGKKSKKGRMTVNRVDGEIITLCGDDKVEESDLLEIVFINGDLIKQYSFDEIRDRANI